MNQKKNLWCLLAILLVTMFCTGVSSCSNDGDNDFELIESQMSKCLESNFGIRIVSDGKSRTFNMTFSNGKTTQFMSSSWAYWLQYFISGNLVYIKDKDFDKYYGNILESGIRITTLSSSKIKFYLANHYSEKYSGIKQEVYI